MFAQRSDRLTLRRTFAAETAVPVAIPLAKIVAASDVTIHGVPINAELGGGGRFQRGSRQLATDDSTRL